VSATDPKAFALADDCTLLVELSVTNLNEIIQVLRKFEDISGLGCNVEKTVLMQIGCNDPLAQQILDMGFIVKDEITLLGTLIKNCSPCFVNNEDIIIQKIRKVANHWKRFNLSLPGRISIAKTFLYSQINCQGCFIPFNANKLSIMGSEIEEYVAGKLKIAKHRFYEPLENGGIGLFNLKNFLASQCCTWLKRAYTPNDLWKKELFRFSNGSIFNLRKKNFNKSLNPVLYHIADCFETFLCKFTVKNENFLESCIFENPCLTFDVGRSFYLKENFFSGQELERYGKNLKLLTVRNFLDDERGVLSRQQFTIQTGIELSDLKCNKLRSLVNTARIKFSKNTRDEKKLTQFKIFV
jgi:hypothetical protein